MLQKMNLHPEVELIIERLFSAGYRADVVGGAVRDHLLLRPSFDYDITTSATPEEVRRVFRDFRIVDTGIKHGTVTLVLDEGSYEITTWRLDGEYLDNRHPDSVTFTRTLAEDLARRDFTVNAICYNPKDGFTDLFSGLDDLREGIIRAVGDPTRRFREDALRIMRAVRFSASLGFRMDEETGRAACLERGLLRRISGERILVELKKLLAAPHAYRAIENYHEIIATVLPELDAVRLPDKDKFDAADPTSRTLSLFALGAPDNAAAAYSLAMRRLHSDNRMRLVGEKILSLASAEILSRYDALSLLASSGEEVACGVLSLGILLGKYGEQERQILSDAISSGLPYRISELAIGGEELLALGIRGKDVGDTLHSLLHAVMRGECENARDALLLYLRCIKK